MKNYIIDFTDDQTDENIAAFLKQNKLKTTSTFEHFAKTVIVIAPDTFSIDKIYPEITHITNADTEVQLLLDTKLDEITIDPKSTDQWWYPAISINIGTKIDQPWQFIRRGGFGTVYVVDSGCNISHPEFSERPVEQFWSFLSGDHADRNGHGTALSSVLCGKTIGMGRATVKNVKVFDKTKPTQISDIVAGLHAVVDDHIKTPTNKVVNLSWSIPKNPLIEEKLAQMRALGLSIVCASGNSGAKIADVTPASMASITTVGSFGPDYKPSDFTDFTDSSIAVTKGPNNTGPGLDIWAPGENILCASLDGGYAAASGTSMASAVFSGCAVAFLGSFPDRVAVDNPDDLYRFVGMRIVRDLLDLSDPRYSACPNAIALIRVAQDEPEGLHGYMGIFHPGDAVSYELVMPETIDDVVLHEMPVWLTYDKGRLIGTAPSCDDVTALRFAATITASGKSTDHYILGFVVSPDKPLGNESILNHTEPADYTLLSTCCPQAGRTYCCYSAPDYIGRCDAKSPSTCAGETNGVDCVGNGGACP